MTVKEFIFSASDDIKFTFSCVKGEFNRNELLGKQDKIFRCDLLDHVVTRYWAIDINHIHICC